VNQLDDDAPIAGATLPQVSSDGGIRDGVLILCVSSFGRLRAIADSVTAALPQRKVLFVAAHPPAGASCVDLYAGFDGREARLAATADTIRDEFGIEPAKLYQSDLRYRYHAESEETLASRTLWVLRHAKRMIEENAIGRIFMTGGGSLETNAVFELSRRMPGLRAFRIHPFGYLDPSGSGFRHFFTDSNLQHLPVWPKIDRDSDRFQRARHDAAHYVESIAADRFRPDQFARAHARRGTFTPGVAGLLVALAKHVAEHGYARLHRRPVRNVFRQRALSFFRKAYLDVSRRSVPSDWPYFVYVLHHPADSQLLLRGRQFCDQVALCRLLAANMPAGTRLVVKEHPVNPGMLAIADMRRMRRLYANLAFADYSSSFRELVRGASGVITINSTAGLEAAILGVPVIVLGEGIYRDAPFTHTVTDFAALTDMLTSILVDRPTPKAEDIVELITCVLYHTEVAETVDDEATVAAISRGIMTRVAR